LSGKISNAQTFQDISALQTQFVQDRIQAFVTQVLELQQLIGESFPEAATRQIAPLTRYASYNDKKRLPSRRGFP